MKVHLIKKQTIEDYITKNARSKVSFEIWFSIIKRVDWEVPNDIKWIGTHAEYTKLCNDQKQYEVSSF